MSIFIHSLLLFSDSGNIAIGILFVFIGITGFTILKLSERRKDKK